MYDQAQALSTSIEDAWLDLFPTDVPRIVDDVRNATPPCILLTPPGRVYDLPCGRTLAWALKLLAPGPGNADTWRELDKLAQVVEHTALPIERMEPGSYRLTPDREPLPCLIVHYQEAT